METADQRIVVQATASDRKAIVAKSGKPGLSISELIRRGAFAYEPGDGDAELGALTDAARAAADRAGVALDDALDG